MASASSFEGFNAAFPQSQRDAQLQQVRELLQSAIASKTPFAMVRHGDGEERWVRWTRRKALHGETLNDKKDLQWLFYSSLGASIPPSSELDILSQRWHSDNLFCDLQLVRMSDATLEAFRENRGLSRQCQTVLPLRSGMASVATLREVLPSGCELVLLTCRRGAARALEEALDVRVARVIVIPSEKKFRKALGDPDQSSIYPSRLWQVVNEEIPDAVGPGRVCILGVGWLKPICAAAIKRAGGIAIDVGSLCDQLAGLVTRGRNSVNKSGAPQRARRISD